MDTHPASPLTSGPRPQSLCHFSPPPHSPRRCFAVAACADKDKHTLIYLLNNSLLDQKSLIT